MLGRAVAMAAWPAGWVALGVFLGAGLGRGPASSADRAEDAGGADLGGQGPVYAHPRGRGETQAGAAPARRSPTAVGTGRRLASAGAQLDRAGSSEVGRRRREGCGSGAAGRAAAGAPAAAVRVRAVGGEIPYRRSRRLRTSTRSCRRTRRAGRTAERDRERARELTACRHARRGRPRAEPTVTAARRGLAG
jgi:hypothetical protein